MGYNSIAWLPLTAGLTAIGVIASYFLSAPAKKPAKTGKASAAFDIDMKGIEDILRKRGI